jgi:peptidylprolyl isomerase
VRRLAALFVVPTLLLAAACGGNNDKGSSSSSASGLPAITAGAKFGTKPTVAKGKGDPPTKLVTATPVEGDGAVVKKSDYITVNYSGQIYASGKVFDNSYDRGSPFSTQIGTSQVIKGWDQALVGKKVGSRVEMTIPPDLAYGSQAQTSIPANSTLVFVVDVVAATQVPTTAKGTVQQQNDASLPKIGTNTDGKAPSLTVPTAKTPPTKLVSNYVIEGNGKTVKSTNTVVVHYVGALWKTGKPFDSSYTKGQPVTFTLNQLSVKGLSQGLVGKKAGSRVLLVIPPSLGFGTTAQTGIPANSTLAFSVDILAVL